MDVSRIFVDFLFDRHNMSVGVRLVMNIVVTALNVGNAVFGRHSYFLTSTIGEGRRCK